MTFAEVALSVALMAAVAIYVDLSSTIAELRAEKDRIQEEFDDLVERFGRKR